MKRERMKKYGVLPLLLLAALFVGNLFPITARAETEDATQVIYDDAGLFTDEEIASLEKSAEKYGKKAGVQYYIVTKNVFMNDDPDGYSGYIRSYTEELSENFYDTVALPSGYKDAVIFTIVIEYWTYKEGEEIDPDAYLDRYADVSGQGYGKERLDDERAQMVFDKAQPLLSKDNFAGAARRVMRVSSQYMKFRPGVNPDNLVFKLWFQILISLLIGGVVVCLMAAHSGGKITVGERDYRDAQHSRILARRDVYLRTTVTKTKRESSSSGGGHGGGGGHSGGGGSHGGGHF